MAKKPFSSLEPYLLSVLRIVAGFLFFPHGAQKLLGMFGGTAQPFGTKMWFAGVLELAGGLMLLAGLCTRPVAFVLSGQMAVAYFQAHASQNFWPLLNRGELAVIYCFLFLYFAAAGGGPISLDRAMKRA